MLIEIFLYNCECECECLVFVLGSYLGCSELTRVDRLGKDAVHLSCLEPAPRPRHTAICGEQPPQDCCWPVLLRRNSPQYGRTASATAPSRSLQPLIALHLQPHPLSFYLFAPTSSIPYNLCDRQRRRSTGASCLSRCSADADHPWLLFISIGVITPLCTSR